MADSIGAHGRPLSQDRIRFFLEVTTVDGVVGAWPKLWPSIDALHEHMDLVSGGRDVVTYFRDLGAVHARIRTTYIGGGVHG